MQKRGQYLRYAAIPLSFCMTHAALQSSVLAPLYAQDRGHAMIWSLMASILVTAAVAWDAIKTPFLFMYSCFLMPLGQHKDLQGRLEAFYQGQASIYDASRTRLLRGRSTMLKLCAAQLKEQKIAKPVWIDLGGGTGWNIEKMNEVYPIKNFEKVILVDLTPSLCKIATERFHRRGWKNVEVLCQDAVTFRTSVEGRVSLVTMSYSLSMMPQYHAVVDRVLSLLAPEGFMGVTDFYVSGKSSAPGDLNRHCNWLTRNFWQNWFDLDHIHLAPGRRDYLEYRFNTIRSLNLRNHFIVPYLIQIPYYIWLGSPNVDNFSSASSVRSASSSSSASSTSSIVARPWRLDYDPSLAQHTQFRSYIYSFTWEDPRVDLEHLNLNSEDVMMVITSAGDNALEYAIQNCPKRIHCVDMNPCQNHLMELKLAGIATLAYKDFWAMFGDGKHPNFKSLLHDKISPHLSSYAFQYWDKNHDRFKHTFYKTGYSGLALSIVEWWIKLNGISSDIHALCHANTIAEQEKIWRERIQPLLFTPIVRRIMDNPVVMWNALGVPMNQINMFLKDGTTAEYMENTFNPIPSRSLFKTDEYFYYLCLMRHYTPSSCPSYLTRDGFSALKKNLDCFRLHTDSILSTLESFEDAYLTKLVVMDHMDWFDPHNDGELDQEITQMARSLKIGGQVYYRSAGKYPWYNRLFEKHGFTVEALAIREQGYSIDRVNMYASFYRATLQQRQQ